MRVNISFNISETDALNEMFKNKVVQEKYINNLIKEEFKSAEDIKIYYDTESDRSNLLPVGTDTYREIASMIMENFPGRTLNGWLHKDSQSLYLAFNPESFIMIIIKMNIHEDFHCTIWKNEITSREDEGPSIKEVRLFSGALPGDENQEPDYKFIENILINYKVMG